jgi:hypothetical protein
MRLKRGKDLNPHAFEHFIDLFGTYVSQFPQDLTGESMLDAFRVLFDLDFHSFEKLFEGNESLVYGNSAKTFVKHTFSHILPPFPAVR